MSSMPLYYNGATPNNDKKRKLNVYVEGDHYSAEFATGHRPLHNHHHAYRAVSFVPPSHQSPNHPSLGYPPPVNLPRQRSDRNGYPQHQTPLPSDKVLNDSVKDLLMPPFPPQTNQPSALNDNMPQNPFMPPLPSRRNRPSAVNDNIPQNPFMPPLPSRRNRPSAVNDNIPQNPFMPPLPSRRNRPSALNDNMPQNPFMPPLPSRRNRPSALNDNMPQNPFMPPLPSRRNRPSAVNNNMPQNPFMPPLPSRRNMPSALNDNIPQNPFMPPLPFRRNRPLAINDIMPQNPFMPPSPAQGNRPSVLEDHFLQSPSIPPVPVQDNMPFKSDKREFDIPKYRTPFDNTLPGKGLDDWVAGLTGDQQQFQIANLYMPQNNQYGQGQNHHLQYDRVQDLESILKHGTPFNNTLPGKGLDDWLGGWAGDQQQFQIANLYMPQNNQHGQGQNHHLQYDMVQDLELPQEFPLGAPIPASPSPEPEEPQALALPPPPAALPNALQKMCNVPGCNQPTLAQTRRSSKCRDHMENPPPQSREAALVEAVEAGHGYCSGCNGLRPRRAPGRNCWECLCKNRRQRFGVCDGCPASWCPNRVVGDA